MKCGGWVETLPRVGYGGAGDSVRRMITRTRLGWVTGRGRSRESWPWALMAPVASMACMGVKVRGVAEILVGGMVVRFVGMGTNNKMLYIIGGICMIAAMTLKQCSPMGIQERGMSGEVGSGWGSSSGHGAVRMF